MEEELPLPIRMWRRHEMPCATIHLSALETRMPNKKKSRPARKPGSAKKRARKGLRETASQQASAPAAVLDAQKLKDLYSSMLKCRMLGDKMRELASAQAAGAGETAPGGEAVLAGAVAHALPQDSVIAVKNQLLAEFLFSQGARLNTLLAEFKKAAESAPGPAEGTPYDAHTALARAMSKANEMKGSTKVSFVFCGDEAAALAFQLDMLGLVARHKLPLVCLIET